MSVPDAQLLDRIRFLLVETSHPGNIGAVARAMKAMRLSRLGLVKPRHFPSADALARAAGADDLLAAADVHEDLPGALVGCRLVVGSSARLRSLEWPLLEPADCARRLLEEARDGDVALLFGRESSGLTNDELARCHYLVNIPTNPQFSSLNVAAAAQILAFEIHRAWCGTSRLGVPDRSRDPAPAEAVEGFHAHLEQTLTEIGFSDPGQCQKLLRRLRRLFNRARPDRVELNILRGILSAAQGRKTPDRFRKKDAEVAGASAAKSPPAGALLDPIDSRSSDG